MTPDWFLIWLHLQALPVLLQYAKLRSSLWGEKKGQPFQPKLQPKYDAKIFAVSHLGCWMEMLAPSADQKGLCHQAGQTVCLTFQGTAAAAFPCAVQLASWKLPGWCFSLLGVFCFSALVSLIPSSSRMGLAIGSKCIINFPFLSTSNQKLINSYQVFPAQLLPFRFSPALCVCGALPSLLPATRNPALLLTNIIDAIHSYSCHNSLLHKCHFTWVSGWNFRLRCLKPILCLCSIRGLANLWPLYSKFYFYWRFNGSLL